MYKERYDELVDTAVKRAWNSMGQFWRAGNGRYKTTGSDHWDIHCGNKCDCQGGCGAVRGLEILGT